MTRSELIATLACRFQNLMAKDAEIAVKEVLDAIGAALVQGNRVEIRGFGSFGLNYCPARTARNPKSGQKVVVSAKYIPHFKTRKELRDRVDAPAKRVALTVAA
jgi:integration host factor subunit beta